MSTQQCLSRHFVPLDPLMLGVKSFDFGTQGTPPELSPVERETEVTLEHQNNYPRKELLLLRPQLDRVVRQGDTSISGRDLL